MTVVHDHKTAPVHPDKAAHGHLNTPTAGSPAADPNTADGTPNHLKHGQVRDMARAPADSVASTPGIFARAGDAIASLFHRPEISHLHFVKERPEMIKVLPCAGVEIRSDENVIGYHGNRIPIPMRNGWATSFAGITSDGVLIGNFKRYPDQTHDEKTVAFMATVDKGGHLNLVERPSFSVSKPGSEPHVYMIDEFLGVKAGPGGKASASAVAKIGGWENSAVVDIRR